MYRNNSNGLLSSKGKNYAIWKEGIKKHLNKEFAIKLTKNLEEKETRKKALINFIVNAYNIHEGGKKRKYTLSQFLNLHNLN